MTLNLAIDNSTHLRSLYLADAPDLFALIDRSRPYLCEWLNWVDQTKSIEDVQSFIQNSQEQAASGRGPVCCITHADELVGICGFKPIDETSRSAELGYWLAESFAGRGIMTRCVKALVDHAFRELELNRIELRAAVGNIRSQGVAKRLGFTQEGILRDVERLNDHFVDHVVYSMLKREWNSELKFS